MLTHHSAECTMDPNYNVPKCLGVDATKCWTDKLPNSSLTTPPYWTALFSDNFALRGVFRLG
jgi:hypothetical protein